jgi:hypothetical protein
MRVNGPRLIATVLVALVCCCPQVEGQPPAPLAKQKVPDRFNRLLEEVLRRDMSDDQVTDALYLAVLTRYPGDGERKVVRVLLEYHRPMHRPSPSLPEAERRAELRRIQDQVRRKVYPSVLKLLLNSPESVHRGDPVGSGR